MSIKMDRSIKVTLKKCLNMDMKKIKQILAIIGVIVLVGLYISTIVCAVSASENFMNMLMTSIYASVIIPVLIWAYSFIYKLIKKDSEEKDTTAH